MGIIRKTNGCVKKRGPCSITNARGTVSDAFDGDAGWQVEGHEHAVKFSECPSEGVTNLEKNQYKIGRDKDTYQSDRCRVIARNE